MQQQYSHYRPSTDLQTYVIGQGLELFNLAEQEIFRDNEFSYTYINRLITFTNINKFKKNNEYRICAWTLPFPLNRIKLRFTVFCFVFGVFCEDLIWFLWDTLYSISYVLVEVSVRGLDAHFLCPFVDTRLPARPGPSPRRARPHDLVPTGNCACSSRSLVS